MKVNIFFLNFVVMILEGLFFLYNPNNRRQWGENDRIRKKKWFVILVCIQWIFIIGLRADTVGSDTSNYHNMFMQTNARSWNEILSDFKIFKEDFMEGLSAEILYFLFAKAMGSIWLHYGFYKFVIGTVFMVSLSKYIYENSEDPFLSFSLFDAILYNLFAITGYRQVLSITIGILWNYKNIKNRKFVPFITLLIIAALFHKSTLIFFPFYFVSQIKVTKSYKDASLILVLLMIAFRSSLFPFFTSILGYDKEYGRLYSVAQDTFLIMYALLSAVILWRSKKCLELFPESTSHFNAFVCSAVMLPFAMMSPTGLRAVYDFFLIVMLLIPEVMNSFEKKLDIVVAYSVTTSVFFLYILSSATPYLFWWQ